MRKLGPYGALMINRIKRILFVFHLYCCSKHNFLRYLERMLRAFLYILSYILCDWITSMRNTKHELSTINMFYSPQKIVILPHPTTPPPPPPHNVHFLLSPRWPLWRGSTACYTFYRANANLFRNKRRN